MTKSGGEAEMFDASQEVPQQHEPLVIAMVTGTLQLPEPSGKSLIKYFSL